MTDSVIHTIIDRRKELTHSCFKIHCDTIDSKRKLINELFELGWLNYRYDDYVRFTDTEDVLSFYVAKHPVPQQRSLCVLPYSPNDSIIHLYYKDGKVLDSEGESIGYKEHPIKLTDVNIIEHTNEDGSKELGFVFGTLYGTFSRKQVGQMIDRAALIYGEEFIKSVTQYDVKKKYMVSCDSQYAPTHELNSLEAANREVTRLIKKLNPPQTVRVLSVEKVITSRTETRTVYEEQ